MVVAGSRGKKFVDSEFFRKFETQIKTLKTVLSHVGLYIGLIAYTALGALVRFFKYGPSSASLSFIFGLFKQTPILQ